MRAENKIFGKLYLKEKNYLMDKFLSLALAILITSSDVGAGMTFSTILLN